MKACQKDVPKKQIKTVSYCNELKVIKKTVAGLNQNGKNQK